MESKTATLTHKVRNPQNLDNWLDIWETKVTADFNGDNSDERDDSSEKIIITPSKDWQIPTKNLIESTDDNNKKISFPGTIEAEKIINLPTNHILITNGNGAIVTDTEHFIIPANNRSQTLFLNEQGDWTDVGYNLSIEEDSDAQSLSAIGFQSYSYNLKLTQNGNEDKEDVINIQLNNPIYSVFTEKNNNDKTPSSLSLSVENIMDKDIAAGAGISVSKLDSEAQTAVNNNKTIDEENKTVSYNLSNASKVWATDKDGKPSWQNSTAQFDTKLFGAIISEGKPKLESDISIFTKFYSKNFTGSFTKANNSKIEGTGQVRYKQEYDKLNEKLTIYLTYFYFHTDNNSDFYVWAPSSDDPVNEIYNFDGTKKIISFSSLLDYYIDTYLENYLNEGISFDDFKASIDNSNSGLSKFGNELFNICREYYENNNLPENVNIALWEDEFNTIKNTPYIVNEWDYNHCGIWIEI